MKRKRKDEASSSILPGCPRSASMRDLEAMMSRHLPRTSVTAAATAAASAPSPSSGSGDATAIDPSSAASSMDAHRGEGGGHPYAPPGVYDSSGAKSDGAASTSGAIQWVGIGNSSERVTGAADDIVEEMASPSQSETESGVLTASSLLRTFYANRESVIRTPGAAPTAAADELQKQQQQQQQQHPHVVTSPFPDQQHPHHHPHDSSNGASHNMLTPPGSHSDAMSYYAAPPPPPHPHYAKGLHEDDDETQQKNSYRHYAHHHHLEAYSSSAAHGHPSLHHHGDSPASSGLYSVDHLNMTPPSSVSPQDHKHHPHHPNHHASIASHAYHPPPPPLAPSSTFDHAAGHFVNNGYAAPHHYSPGGASEVSSPSSSIYANQFSLQFASDYHEAAVAAAAGGEEGQRFPHQQQQHHPFALTPSGCADSAEAQQKEWQVR